MYEVHFTCPLSNDTRKRTLTAKGTYTDADQPFLVLQKVQVVVTLDGSMLNPFDGSIDDGSGVWTAAISLPHDGSASFHVNLIAKNTNTMALMTVASDTANNVTINNTTGTDCP